MNNDGKPRDYFPYGHKKVFTRKLKRYYLTLLSYGIPIRLRVLRRVSKTASGADAYAVRAVDRYKSFCTAAQADELRVLHAHEFSDDVKEIVELLERDNAVFLNAFSLPTPDEIFAGDSPQIDNRNGVDFVLHSGDGANG